MGLGTNHVFKLITPLGLLARLSLYMNIWITMPMGDFGFVKSIDGLGQSVVLGEARR